VSMSWGYPTFFIRNHLRELGVIFLNDSCMTKIFVFVVQCQPLTKNSFDTTRKRILLINCCSLVVDIIVVRHKTG
jgi:hypothetical protein